MTENLRAKSLTVVGVIPSFAFQRAKETALALHRCMPYRFPAPVIEGLLELEWYERLMEWRHLHGPPFFRLKRSVAVFLNDKFIGSDNDLLKLANRGNIFVESIPRKDTAAMKKKFRQDYVSHLRSTELIYCYLDICVDGTFIGTLVFRLYSNVLPKTCENFTTLCLGTKGNFLSYKGSRIHRIVKNGWLQGGDIQYQTGGGGFSIYCSPLEDECCGISHDRRGVLSMANDGKHTNASQFFITLNPTTWMDTYYVAFGQLVEGVKVLNQIENIATFREKPLKKIEIKNCGKLDLHDVIDLDLRFPTDLKIPEERKKPKKVEAIAEELMRLLMEAVTECLAIKEHVPDVLHEGDTPSVLNLELYFQGLYSLPDDILEQSAKYLRTMRREMFRHLKPSATEVVEVITYDMLVAVMTKLVDLDDVRETTGHPVYQRLLDGINMEVEMADKTHVRKFVDQLANTAEKIVEFISRKLNWMRRSSRKIRVFQNQMTEWVQSFALQETFANDVYRITDRPQYDPYSLLKKKGPCDEEEEEDDQKGKKLKKKEEERKPCCGEEKKEKVHKKKRLGKEQTVVDICCDGKDDSEDEELRISDFFSACRYGLKRPPRDREGRIPLLDLIEISRFQLRFMRHHDKRLRSRARICLEKKLKRWMNGVDYVTETNWIRQTVFSNDDVCLDHTEEIMYGAMTVGLLEMYFLMEQYLKHPPKKRYITKMVYPSESGEGEEEVCVEEEEESCSTESDEVPARGGTATRAPTERKADATPQAQPPVARTKPCPCGDICCDCPPVPASDEAVLRVPPTPPPSPVASSSSSSCDDELGEDGVCVAGEGGGVKEPSVKVRYVEEVSCISTSEVEDLNVEDLMAEVMGEAPNRVDINSFKWLQDYIKEEGCLFKTEFVTEVHKWLEDEVFNYRGFLSKHSLVTRASLLSFSFSLASLIQEDNLLKSELKDFIYDLWELYFKEMFKEALLEYPPEEGKGDDKVRGKGDGKGDGKSEEGEWGETVCSSYDDVDEDPCARLKVKEFDFDKYCKEVAEKALAKNIWKKDETPYPERRDGSEGEDRYEPVAPGAPEIEPPVPEPEPVSRDPEPEPEPAPRDPERDSNVQDYEEPGAVTQPTTTTTTAAAAAAAKKKKKIVKKIVRRPRPVSEFDETLVGEDQMRDISEPDVEEIEEEVEEEEEEEGIPEKKKKTKEPILVRELIPSDREVRIMPPYVLPFWIKFLTEIIKRALGIMSKVSRLPRRLYFQSESEVNFEDRMKEWIEFNRFAPPRTEGRDIRDFIASHHVSIHNLDETARSFLKKKVVADLVEKSTRQDSAQLLAEELLVDLVGGVMDKTDVGESGKLIWSDFLASAVSKSSGMSRSEYGGGGDDDDDDEGRTMDTERGETETEVETEAEVDVDAPGGGGG